MRSRRSAASTGPLGRRPRPAGVLGASADNPLMRRFGVRGDPEEEAIRLYNRVRRGGRWPESYWERPGRIRAAWAVLDYWLRRILGAEDPSAYRKLTEEEVVRQSLEKPVAVMEDL